ncbi:MAG: recombination protein RecO [Campylobacteraceae bacterium]|jgi:recombinational DNA repair protein (RecF pathway)|nr:recombination protein RecO [Campylobacteraceae bacterium]MBT5983211.1 recombination protein RecO [Campylobacteraceae bacterium]
MQGFIIDFKPVRDDDLIVTLLTSDEIITTYRFYGARHSHINIGYKIDFELESNLKSTIPRLKDVIQLSFPWILDKEKLYCWQRFLKLFYTHLKGIEELDKFYFNLLSNLVHKITKQNVKRAIIEGYINLLNFEGRLHTDYECLLCEKVVEANIALVRSMLPTHPKCSYSKSFKSNQIKSLFEEKSSIELNDEELDYIWNILLQGI